MTVATPTAPAQTLAPVGRLRRARIGTRLQALGRGLSNLAAAGFVVLLIGAAAFDALWIYSEPVPLGEQGYAIGLGFTILALFLGIAAPWRVKPRRVDGSWARAVATQPAFPRKVRRELHGAELYRARLYVPSFVAVAVLWVVTAVAYYLAFREERADPDVTMHAGYWVAVGLIVAGFVAVLLMIPWGTRRTVLVDDEGNFFVDPGSPNPPASAEPVAQAQPVAAMPPAAAAVEPVAFAPPEAAAQPPTPVPSPVPSPPATTAERDVSGRGRMALGAVVGVLVTVLVLVGAAAFYVLRGGEARSPSEVADLFGQAKVKCMDFDVITDSRATKTLGCRTDDVQIITVTTYGNVPDGDEWLADRCEASQGEAARLRRGYYLRGDDFILDMHQLRHPKFVKPTPIERTSARLGRVLDASVVRYNCNAQ